MSIQKILKYALIFLCMTHNYSGTSKPKKTIVIKGIKGKISYEYDENDKKSGEIKILSQSLQDINYGYLVLVLYLKAAGKLESQDMEGLKAMFFKNCANNQDILHNEIVVYCAQLYEVLNNVNSFPMFSSIYIPGSQPGNEATICIVLFKDKEIVDYIPINCSKDDITVSDSIQLSFNCKPGGALKLHLESDRLVTLASDKTEGEVCIFMDYINDHKENNKNLSQIPCSLQKGMNAESNSELLAIAFLNGSTQAGLQTINQSNPNDIEAHILSENTLNVKGKRVSYKRDVCNDIYKMQKILQPQIKPESPEPKKAEQKDSMTGLNVRRRVSALLGLGGG